MWLAVGLVAAAAIWVLVNGPVEGPVLLVLTPSHGITVADLPSLAALVIAAVLLVRAWLQSLVEARAFGGGFAVADMPQHGDSEGRRWEHGTAHGRQATSESRISATAWSVRLSTFAGRSIFESVSSMTLSASSTDKSWLIAARTLNAPRDGRVWGGDLVVSLTLISPIAWLAI
jgi:hypothetical protein